METILSLGVGHLTSKIIDSFTSLFRTQVIERCSKHRANQFFKEFCLEVELELAVNHSEELNDKLSKILENETSSEVLFEAYRRVTFSKSKELGPRIIAILTAVLVLQGRTADEFEYTMLEAAENLTDDELLGYATFCRKHMTLGADLKAKKVNFDKDGGLTIQWCDEHFDSNWKREEHLSIAPLDLGECIGRWASSIEKFGILRQDVQQREWDYTADTERHIDQDGTAREASWWLYIAKPYFRLAELVERVSQNPRK